jgi:SAM-dependent methyltransferase
MTQERPQSPSLLGEPYRYRDIAEAFGSDAERYHRTRPSYPAVVAEVVLAGLPDRRVLDVGIGTGISAAGFRDAGCSVLGVEPDLRMAAVARSQGFEVEIARFEDWDPGDRRFDAVVAGQTWHWVDPDLGATKAARALRPGGRLGLFWNAADPPAELASAFAALYRAIDTGLPFTPWTAPNATGYGAILDKAADGIRRSHGFGEPERLRLDWSATTTRDAWLDQVPTAGGHNRIPPDKLTLILKGMADAIDEYGGTFTLSYATLLLMTTRVGG